MGAPGSAAGANDNDPQIAKIDREFSANRLQESFAICI